MMKNWARGADWKTYLSFIAVLVTLVLVYGFIRQQDRIDDQQSRLDEREQTLAKVSATAERATRLLEAQQTVLTDRYEAASTQRDQLQRSIDLLEDYLRSQGVEVPPLTEAPVSSAPKPRPTKGPTKGPTKPPKTPQPPPPTPVPLPPPTPTPIPTPEQPTLLCVLGLCVP